MYITRQMPVSGFETYRCLINDRVPCVMRTDVPEVEVLLGLFEGCFDMFHLSHLTLVTGSFEVTKIADAC
jgi:hypothetical protein